MNIYLSFLKYTILLFSLVLFRSTPCFSQTIEIRGKVIDRVSGKDLVAVSVIVDGYKGTVTNGKGEFHLRVDRLVIKNRELSFSYVGYKTLHVSFDDKIVFTIEMEVADNKSREVIVYGNGKSILQKAIEKISVNYSVKQFVQKGVMRVYNLVGDSDYFYKADAIVQLYFPSYTSHGKPVDIKIIQNRQMLLKNPNSSFQKEVVQVKWVGGFYSIPDIVHQYPDYINKNKLKYFLYHEREKMIFEGRRVFVIDFASKKEKDTEGTLYIDTATYAFAGANVTRYNINEFGFVPISMASISVSYQMVDGKWYVKNTHSVTRHVQKIENNNYIREYAAVSIDTANVSPFDYKDIIQRRDENIAIAGKGDSTGWKKYDCVFSKLESSGTISNLPIPVIDTSRFRAQRNKITLRSITSYMQNNMHLLFDISKVPATGTPVAEKPFLINYGFGFAAQFRLYKKIVFENNVITNFGIGGITSSLTNYYLTCSVKINTAHRPLRISPLAGFGYFKFENKSKSEEGAVKSWAAGATIDIELAHTTSLFLRAVYYKTFKNDVG